MTGKVKGYLQDQVEEWEEVVQDVMESDMGLADRCEHYAAIQVPADVLEYIDEDEGQAYSSWLYVEDK